MKHTSPLIVLLLLIAITAPVMAQEPVTTEPGVTVSPIQGVTLETTGAPATPAAPGIGWVSITSTPSAASVELDGKGIGVTPVVGLELGAGTAHTVRISLEGYEPYSSSITVRSGEQSAVDGTLNPVPTPQPTIEPTAVPTNPPIGGGKGWIQVSANVNGATVSFNGNAAGCTITSGSCDTEVAVTGTPFTTFTVQKPGYEVYMGQVTGWPLDGETVHLYATLNPVASVGSIVVTSNPAGAVAYLDGRTWQYTTATFTSVAAGTDHTIQVSQAGYQTYTTTVYVAPGATARVSASLIPTPAQAGSLSITSDLKGADIYVDGQYPGIDPCGRPGSCPRQPYGPGPESGIR